MSFNNYKSIADVLNEFPLIYQEENFIKENFSEISPYFIDRLELILKDGVVFNSEYAICENIISPILVEIWLKYKDKLLLWSHQALNYDEKLSGVPDYIVAQRSPRGKVILDQPYLILVEAKKDNFDEGWGQCLAELIAAQKLNNNQQHKIFGIVSNGKLWEFGQLKNDFFTKNIKYYVLENLLELMGVINFIFSESVNQVLCKDN
ncbi:hypothetical protein H6F32_19460 [Anabaena sp. FACHB-1237]|uniref:hypothetical protein n=1 Tax=Anabaena sp. FACHB-1237 TaxID=2692769 RepID=UPI00167FF1EC|nr:hypothetical protein [Anabaena sp. FACHB-1237]MBD2139681.1 hypothetical protein [Anabaena sp. FACHB-1237]